MTLREQVSSRAPVVEHIVTDVRESFLWRLDNYPWERNVWNVHPEYEIHLVRKCDGVALVGGSHSPELRTLIRQAGVPVITTYVSKASSGMPAIGIDNEAATRELTRYLLSIGHVSFGTIANVPPSNDRSRARLEGVQKALAQAGIELKPSQIIKADHSLAQGRNAFRQLMTDHPEITAVICTTDTLAIGAMAEARKLGFKVPQTLSITGFDDIELAATISTRVVGNFAPWIALSVSGNDEREQFIAEVVRMLSQWIGAPA